MLFRARAALVLILGAASPAQDDGEFGAHGFDVVRVENEAKLSVPRHRTEEVWRWLADRYAAPSFLDRDGHAFRSTFGDERFVDRYFDSPELQLLATQSGVRHRRRVVMEGSAIGKDGRQLVQMKLNRDDASGLERSEIKFEVKQPPGVDLADEPSLLALVDADDRAALAQRIAAAGLDPLRLQPILTVDQNRRRVYIADQHGPFATVTLDMVTCSGWWQTLRFTEIELELNEIRYTEADARTREWMCRINARIQDDLAARFPDVGQDQTPKYNKSFALLEAGMPMSLPLRRLIAWRWTPRDVVGLALLSCGGLAALAAFAFVLRRRRLAAEDDADPEARRRVLLAIESASRTR
jgi:hypothetical protein